MSNSLWPHGLQDTRLPCPSLSPWVCLNSCPFCWWCYLTILSTYHFLWPSIFPSIKIFSSELVLHIGGPKYWSFSFSISPFNEYSWLISFRIDYFDLLAVQGASQESSPEPQFESINSSALNLLYGPTLISIHCWEPVRHSTRDKGHEEGGSAYAKAGSSLRSPPRYSRASTPEKKPESAYFIALCSHLWLYWGLSPTTISLSLSKS